jgi:hypothetical protein
MPAKLNEFFLRLKGLFTRRHMEKEMAEELEFHQSLLRERLLREGMPQLEVDAAARRAFGNPRRWHISASDGNSARSKIFSVTSASPRACSASLRLSPASPCSR